MPKCMNVYHMHLRIYGSQLEKGTESPGTGVTVTVSHYEGAGN